MLLNGVHLLPDPTGALVWPRERVLAFSDPIAEPGGRTAPREAAETLRRLTVVLRQRRPATVVWLGSALPALLSARDRSELEAQAATWIWLAGDDEFTLGDLTFRLCGRADANPGEVSAQPWPVAVAGGVPRPCYVLDGRRLILPPFGPRDDGTDVMAPAVTALFRRPFHVLMLDHGRILTMPRTRLDGAKPARGGGTRMSL